MNTMNTMSTPLNGACGQKKRKALPQCSEEAAARGAVPYSFLIILNLLSSALN